MSAGVSAPVGIHFAGAAGSRRPGLIISGGHIGRCGVARPSVFGCKVVHTGGHAADDGDGLPDNGPPAGSPRQCGRGFCAWEPLYAFSGLLSRGL